MPREPEVLDTATQARPLGQSELAVAKVGDATITREVVYPGWRWSTDVKPIVRTDLCRAMHHVYIVSGRMHLLMEDGAEFDIAAGDVAVVPPGHDAWVVGDEPCELVDFSPTYARLIDAGEAYNEATGGSDPATRRSRADAAKQLRAQARAGRLDASAVDLVLGAVGHRRPRRSGPAGLTEREVEVLMLIATGASTKQVGNLLGIAPKTVGAHVERIYAKTGASTRSDATRFAIAHGLVSPVLPGGARAR